MNQVARIVDQFQRAYDGDAWHGPPLLRLLADLTPEQASRKPIAGAHSIREIVLHLSAWHEVVRERLEGSDVEPSPEEDWPSVGGVTPPSGEGVLARLEQTHRALVRTAAGLSPEDLDRRVPGQEYSVYVMLHGVIQHDLYHAGQIALLRKGGRP